ncbi:MAG: 30S ribosomal protein S8 [Puniceicoccaceae bacterium]
MAVHDTIGDYLTMIRNASRAGKESIEAGFSKTRLAIAEILFAEGYIAGFEQGMGESGKPVVRLKLKYQGKTSAITDIQRVSRPGCRIYSRHNEIPKALGGLGISILTTSKGLLKDVDARRGKLGGEIVCQVW